VDAFVEKAKNDDRFQRLPAVFVRRPDVIVYRPQEISKARRFDSISFEISLRLHLFP